MRDPFKFATKLEEGGTQKVVAKRSMSTVLTALLMFTLAADSHPFESRTSFVTARSKTVWHAASVEI